MHKKPMSRFAAIGLLGFACLILVVVGCRSSNDGGAKPKKKQGYKRSEQKDGGEAKKQNALKDGEAGTTPAWLVLPAGAKVETSIAKYPGFEGMRYYLKMTVPGPAAAVVAQMTSSFKPKGFEAMRRLGKPTPFDIFDRKTTMRYFGFKSGPDPSSVVIYHDGATEYIYLYAWDHPSRPEQGDRGDQVDRGDRAGDTCTIELVLESAL